MSLTAEQQKQWANHYRPLDKKIVGIDPAPWKLMQAVLMPVFYKNESFTNIIMYAHTESGEYYAITADYEKKHPRSDSKISREINKWIAQAIPEAT